MKNTVALGWDKRAVVSPHISDLGSPRSLSVFEQVIADLCKLYQVSPQLVVHDAHPEYTSSRWAVRSGLPFMSVLHHHAHASALAEEFPEVARWLVFAWDGMGLGMDNTLWGGEGLLGRPGNWQRAATWRSFRLPGNDLVGREPWRSAASLCWESGRESFHTHAGTELLKQAWKKELNAPLTTSVGRLFDAAASMLGLVQESSFEGQGPMWLEAASSMTNDHLVLPLKMRNDDTLESDWEPLITMLQDKTLSVAQRGGLFHSTLAYAALQQAQELRNRYGVFSVGLSGGVFQNCFLVEQLKELLEMNDFEVFVPHRVPCNDGGISFGQLVEAAARI